MNTYLSRKEKELFTRLDAPFAVAEEKDGLSPKRRKDENTSGV